MTSTYVFHLMPAEYPVQSTFRVNLSLSPMTETVNGSMVLETVPSPSLQRGDDVVDYGFNGSGVTWPVGEGVRRVGTLGTPISLYSSFAFQRDRGATLRAWIELQKEVGNRECFVSKVHIVPRDNGTLEAVSLLAEYPFSLDLELGNDAETLELTISGPPSQGVVRFHLPPGVTYAGVTNEIGVSIAPNSTFRSTLQFSINETQAADGAELGVYFYPDGATYCSLHYDRAYVVNSLGNVRLRVE